MKKNIANQFFKALEYSFEYSQFSSQKELCLATGLSSSVISELLNRKKAYGPKTQTKIANAFGYDLVDFLMLGRRLLEGKEQSIENKDKPALTSTPPIKEEGAALTQDALQRYPFANQLIEEINKAAENGWSEMSVVRTLQSTLEKENIRLIELQKKENSAGK